MDKSRTNIAILEPSDIIYEGLSNIILKLKNNYFLYRIADLEELIDTEKNIDYNIALINPLIIQNKDNDFVKLKTSLKNITFISIIYSYFSDSILKKFDNQINITDEPKTIINKINNNNNLHQINNLPQDIEDLTQREVEVLICLTQGKPNKEIAEELNISIHTVISHRKNIIEKTGVKSLSGLTIYALSKNIIQLENN